MNIWFERGFRKKFPGYELSKAFVGHAFLGNSTFSGGDTYTARDDWDLLGKFYKKYPEVKYFP